MPPCRPVLPYYIRMTFAFNLCILLQITSSGVVKMADVGVSKQADMITGTITGTITYVAPEVIRSSVYDSKADIYSFGIMMWEMWYGTRAFFDLGGDLNTFYGDVARGVRPSHVEGRRKPPDGWRQLMQWCWDGEAEERPTAAMCHNELYKLNRDALTVCLNYRPGQIYVNL